MRELLEGAGRRRWLLVLVGLAISAVAAWLAIRGVDLDATLATIRSADPAPLAATLAVIAVQLVIRSWRWQALLPSTSADEGPRERVRIRRIVPVALVGYLGNAVLPARLGEPLRSVVLARRERLPIASVFGSAVLERVLDTFVLAALGLVAAVAIGVEPWIVRVGLIGVVISAVVLVVLALAPSVLPRVRSAALAGVIRLALRFAEVARLRGPRALAVAISLSLVAWLLDATVYWLVARSLGVELAPLGAVLVSAVTVLSTAVPSAPGYVGTFELAAVAALGALGVAPDTALACALVAHAAAVLPMTVAGAAAIAFMGVDLRAGALARPDASEAAA